MSSPFFQGPLPLPAYRSAILLAVSRQTHTLDYLLLETGIVLFPCGTQHTVGVQQMFAKQVSSLDLSSNKLPIVISINAVIQNKDRFNICWEVWFLHEFCDGE